MGKTGLQREMDSFFKETENEQFSIRRMTKSGFSRSRRKPVPGAFLELNDIIWQDFYKEVDYYGYHRQKSTTLVKTLLFARTVHIPSPTIFIFNADVYFSIDLF
jgi:hypothetical protein